MVGEPGASTTRGPGSGVRNVRSGPTRIETPTFPPLVDMVERVIGLDIIGDAPMSDRRHDPIALALFILALTAAALAATAPFGKAHAYSTGPELVKFCKLVKEQNDYLRGFLGELEGAVSQNQSKPHVTFRYGGETIIIDENTVDRILDQVNETRTQWAEGFKSWLPGDFGNECMERHRHVVRKLEDIRDLLGKLKQQMTG